MLFATMLLVFPLVVSDGLIQNQDRSVQVAGEHEDEGVIPSS